MLVPADVVALVVSGLQLLANGSVTEHSCDQHNYSPVDLWITVLG